MCGFLKYTFFIFCFFYFPCFKVFRKKPCEVSKIIPTFEYKTQDSEKLKFIHYVN